MLTLLLTSLLPAACVAPDETAKSRLPTDAEVEQYKALVPPEDHIVCRQEIPVGTNIPRRVCRLVRDIKETSTFHREQMRRVLR